MEQKMRRDLNIMGANLLVLRDKSGLSQEKLCAELQRRGCDIGRTTYAKYESGELNIKVSVIVILKKLYNCSCDDFLAELTQVTSIRYLFSSSVTHHCNAYNLSAFLFDSSIDNKNKILYDEKIRCVPDHFVKENRKHERNKN